MKHNPSFLYFTKIACCILVFLSATLVLSAQYDTIAPPPQEIIDEPVESESKVVVDEPYYQEEYEVSNFESKTLYDGINFKERRLPAVDTRKLQDDEAFWYANAEIKRKKGNVITYVPRRNGNSVDPDEYKRIEKQNQHNPQKGQTEKRESETIEYSPPSEPVSRQPWFRALLWIFIIGGFAGALVWYLVGNNVGLFRKSKKEIDKGADTGDEEMPEDIFAIQYQKEIDKAAADGNYRLAIRLMYLRLLKNLAERNIIRYQQDKTNFDYLMQVHGTPLFNDFSKATRHYEYSWYGNFPVSSEAYSIIKSSFDHFPH